MRRLIGVTLIVAAVITIVAVASASTASNRRLARRDARALLGRVHLPSSAVALSREPSGDGGILARPPFTMGQVIDVHRFWRSTISADAVIAYVQAHRPAGSSLDASGSTGGPSIPYNRFVAFQWAPITAKLGSRHLIVTVVTLADGSTGIRVDGQDMWLAARSPSERVPAGVHEIDLTTRRPGHPPNLSLTIMDHAKIRRLVSLTNGLQIVQPGLTFACPAQFPGAPVITVSFLSRGGTVLAKAMQDGYGLSNQCNPVSFSIRGRSQTSLTGDFVGAIQRLLHVRFR